MTTTAVVPQGDSLRSVKHFNVFEQVRHGFAMRAIPRAVYPLVLQAVEEAFRRRVAATAFAADQLVIGMAKDKNLDSSTGLPLSEAPAETSKIEQ